MPLGPSRHGTKSSFGPSAHLYQVFNLDQVPSSIAHPSPPQVSEMLLGEHEMAFYQWKGELLELLAVVREKLNKVAEVGECERGSEGMVGRELGR
ncbi:unnamed protein product [Closterium sp. NIES-53]